jgi:hypothetical protein
VTKRSVFALFAVVLALGVGFVAGWFAHQHSGSATGTLSGYLLAVGGPPGVVPRPLIGEVVVTDISGAPTATVVVGPDGRYSVVIPPGSYTVKGRSPSYDGGRTLCLGTKPVSVSGGDVVANVLCHLR